MTRYHPFLVALHWLLALLIVMALVFGNFALSAMPNSDPEKVMALRGHMTVGLIILVLMVIRLVVRATTTKPPHADIGNATLNTLSRWAHGLLYLLVFGMIASGMGIAAMAGLPPIVFGGSGDPLPETFMDLPPRIAHGVIGTLLGLMVLGHIGAAFYHQIVRRDRLMGRMWFGKRAG